MTLVKKGGRFKKGSVQFWSVSRYSTGCPISSALFEMAINSLEIEIWPWFFLGTSSAHYNMLLLVEGPNFQTICFWSTIFEWIKQMLQIWLLSNLNSFQFIKISWKFRLEDQYRSFNRYYWMSNINTYLMKIQFSCPIGH